MKSANETMEKGVAALQTAKTTSQTLKHADNAARAIYVKQLESMIGALSLLTRKDFELGDFRDTLESICIIEEDKVKEVKPPKVAPAAIVRSELTPITSDKESGAYVKRCLALLKSMELDCFLVDDKKDKNHCHHPNT